MKIDDKIYYGFSVVAFVGEIVLIGDDFIDVRGVELGCEAKEKTVQRIRNMQKVTIISDSDFANLTADEPAFQMSSDNTLKLEDNQNG